MMSRWRARRAAREPREQADVERQRLQQIEEQQADDSRRASDAEFLGYVRQFAADGTLDRINDIIERR